MKKIGKSELILFCAISIALFVFNLLYTLISPVIGWIFIVAILVGLFVYSKKHPKEKSSSQTTDGISLRDMLLSPKKKWERDKEKYRAIIGKLPSDLVHKLHDMLYKAGLSMGLPSSNLPDELCKAGLAAQAIIENDSYGTITEEQRSKINELFKGFEWVVNEYIPTGKKALAQLSGSDDLGFGLITNSASNAALYTAMNTHDKIKGNEQRIEEFKQMVDRKVISLIEDISKVVF